MEEEIDLRPYVGVIISSWKLIVGATALAVLIALVTVLLLPRSYEAVALVVINQPRQSIQFDTRILSTQTSQSFQVFPELATSDELLQNLLSSADSFLDVESIEDLRTLLRARPGSDASLVRLIAVAPNPEAASQLANIWAELFVTKANELYGDQGGEQVAFFESRLEQAESDLMIAEQTLIDFQGRNQTATFDNELTSLLQTQASLLAAQRSHAFLINDTQNLYNQVQQQETSTEIFANQLNALLLQIRTYNTEFDITSTTIDQTSVTVSARSTVPLVLQFGDPATLANLSLAEQIALLDSTINILETKSEQITVTLEEIEPRILTLQQQKQEMLLEQDRLVLNQELKEEIYTSLFRKVEEERIASQESISGIRLASTASPPENPSGLRRSLVLLGAAVVGLAAGLFLAFVNQWFKTVWSSEENTRRKMTHERSAQA